jgi:cation-transporting ATPase E
VTDALAPDRPDAVPERPAVGADGLTLAEVAERVARGEVNRADERNSRTLGEIVRANVFTRFNGLLGAIGLVVLVAGQWRDALFLGVLVINALVGIVQELRAKRTLDRLAVLSAPRAVARREGSDVVLAVEDVVLDERIVLVAGDQIVADGRVLESAELEVDESLLTGEADPIPKRAGDPLLSGSFVVAGSGAMQATRVGADSYAHRLASDARRFSLAHSELQAGTNQLLRWISWMVLVLGPLLFWSELRRDDQSWQDAVTAAAAGLVGMVPEGLVLLTTLAFVVAVVTLARRQVLVQELPAVEGLARVDVVCLDKTGTLTEGTIEMSEVLPVGDGDVELARRALGALADDPAPNSTLAAIGAVLGPSGWVRTGAVAFSSARKWSGATFAGHGSWILGAPEIVLGHLAEADPVRQRANALADQGRRVVALAHSPTPLADEELPRDRVAVALVVFDERVRPDAAETLRFFAEQGVELKVISGDSPRTVAAVAAATGLVPAGTAGIDARRLGDTPDELSDAIEEHRVFGRVTPQQKRAMVQALQARGHVVAMTGDGVNDALALKDADVGVAMGSGAAATRAVAQLVLLDGRFARMPAVLAEGRRVIANIERVASLFVTKNVMSAALSITSILASLPYPFLPRHLTVFSALTIGVPAFFLALAPNHRRYVPGFLRRVLWFAVPIGLVMAATVLAAYGASRVLDATGDQARSAALLTAMTLGFTVLVLVARPLRPWKLGLIGSLVAAFAILVASPWAREQLALDLPLEVVWPVIPIAAAGSVAVVAAGLLADRATGRRVALRAGDGEDLTVATGGADAESDRASHLPG